MLKTKQKEVEKTQNINAFTCVNFLQWYISPNWPAMSPSIIPANRDLLCRNIAIWSVLSHCTWRKLITNIIQSSMVCQCCINDKYQLCHDLDQHCYDHQAIPIIRTLGGEAASLTSKQALKRNKFPLNIMCFMIQVMYDI